MDWGILQGLGQGLQQLGGMKMEQDAEKRRSLLAEQLQKDREERANRRLIEQEQREQVRTETTADPKQTRWVEKDGAMFEQTRSSTGRVLEEKLADKNDLERINLEKEDARSSIQSRLADAEYKRELIGQTRANTRQTEIENANLPTKYAEDSLYNSARTSAVLQKGEDAAEDVTIADYADDYLEQNPGVAAKWIDTKILTENQAKDAVIQVLREFAKRGVKPSQADFDAALQSYAKRVPKEAADKKAGGIKMSLSG